MSLRPPGTPRAASMLTPQHTSNAGSTPSSLPTSSSSSSRRQSIRPPSSIGHGSASARGSEEMDALKEAMAKHDPGRYGGSPSLDNSPSPVKPRSSPSASGSSSSAAAATTAEEQELRRRAMRRPSAANLRASFALGRSTNALRPTTPTTDAFKVPRTPRTPSAMQQNPLARSHTAATAARLANANPRARPSSASFPSSAAAMPKTTRRKADEGYGVGEHVCVDVLGVRMEGTLLFLGAVQGKEGVWGGIGLDDEWHGRGKNDGTVQGVQYFSCPPASGLFVPFAKLNKTSPAASPSRSSSVASSSAELSAASVARITEGSRASSYVGMTAKELTKKRLDAKESTARSATTSSGTPVKPPRDPLAMSTSSISTPRATAKPRMSIGAGLSSSTRTPRKSLGGPAPVRPPVGYTSTFTPRASLTGSVNGGRFSTSIRNGTNSTSTSTPEVPPLPYDFDGRRSVTPAQQRMVSSSTVRRRISVANLNESTNQSRPATPSGLARSVSRQSFASSSMSRQSQSSSLHFGADDSEEVRKAAQDTREARLREEETKKLLEGSERLGREMENKLDDSLHALRLAMEKIAKLEDEIILDRRKEEADRIERVEGEGQNGDAIKVERERVQELEDRLESLDLSEESVLLETQKSKREIELQLAVRQGELESTKERMESAAQEAEVERVDLNRQLDALREAGQSLCSMYEERLSKVDADRLEAIELAESLTSRLEAAAASPIIASPIEVASSSSTFLSMSTSTAAATERINAESALADAVHMRGRMMSLEDQLEDTKSQLETEVIDAERRKLKSVEVEASLKKEVKSLADSVERLSVSDTRSAGRIEELEAALVESHAALENERSEVEVLRLDATSSSSIADEVKRTQKQIVTLKTERAAALRDLELAKRETEENVHRVGQLRQDLRSAEEMIDRQHQERSASLELDRASIATSDSHREEIESRDEEIRSLRMRLSTTSPARSRAGIQDSPTLFAANFSGSSPDQQRRGSVASLSGLSMSGNRRSSGGKDDLAASREQIVGLKMIIASMGDDNAEMLKRNESLTTESQKLRDNQKALEITAENLMLELSNGASNSDRSTFSVTQSSTAPLEREVEELKLKLGEVEKRSAREIKALNQEVSELEALVESKIFHEDELESEVKKYRAIAEQGGGGGTDTLQPLPSLSHTLSRTSLLDDDCEMCGKLGHDVEDCPDFGSPSKAATKVAKMKSPRSSDDYCDDCEEYGHSLAACPLANEMF